MAACSIELVITCDGPSLARTAPISARLSASVPLPVKMISLASALSNAATCARAFSTASRAIRPSACWLDAIAERILEEGKHGLKHAGIERGSSGMIEINAP